MKKLVEFLSILSLVAAISCEEKPLLLIEGFYSYDNYTHVANSNLNSEIILGNRDGLLYVKIPDNRHLYEDGEVKLMFYEDQLASVGFFPNDTSQYFTKIDSLIGRRMLMEEEIILGNLSIFKSNEWKKEICYGCSEFFISWSDVRLLEKYKGKIW